MDRDEARKATRRLIVEDVRVIHLKRGDPFFPQGYFTDGEDIKEVWQVFITAREGLRPSQVSLGFFRNKDEVIKYQRDHPVGSELERLSGEIATDRRMVQNFMQPDFPFGVAAGDSESPLAFEVLGDAGIYQYSFGPISKEVTDYTGPERITELKEMFGENWQTAAAFEYCWLNLPHSSPAFVAASYQYHYYITQDDFSAGYHWRDLEIMVHKVEEEAIKSLETRKRAGQSGSKRSSEAKAKRRAELLAKIEVIAARNPDIRKFGEEQVARLACEECKKENPYLWKQGRGQVAEYLGELRRGEAGPDMQKRYLTLFGSKPPKRF